MISTRRFLGMFIHSANFCLITEYTVLSLPFFSSKVSCALCIGKRLYIFFLVFFKLLYCLPPILINSILLILVVTYLAYLLTLIWICLVFNAMNPPSFSAIVCFISSSTSGQNKI